MSDKDHAYTLRVIGENLLKEHSAYSSWAQSCKRAADEIESLQSRLDKITTGFNDLQRRHMELVERHAENVDRLGTALALLAKIETAVNDPLLNQRVRISIASDIQAFLVETSVYKSPGQEIKS